MLRKNQSVSIDRSFESMRKGDMVIKAIARIRSDYTEKFGIPRQSGLVPELTAEVVFEPEYRDIEALRGIEGFSHLWLIWEFSEVRRRGKAAKELRQDLNNCEDDRTHILPDWSPTVRPPRLGGNERLGVFATRSPFRPNPIGLSCVRIEEIDFHTIDGPVIRVSGADLMNGTPIFDIKPYIPYADAHPEALGGFTSSRAFEKVQVVVEPEAARKMRKEELEELRSVLEQDPRPAYKRGENKTYRFSFAEYEIEFTSDERGITVTDCIKR